MAKITASVYTSHVPAIGATIDHSMTGMSEEEYRDMMIAGGRSIEGNRYTREWGKK